LGEEGEALNRLISSRQSECSMSCMLEKKMKMNWADSHKWKSNFSRFSSF